jgi:MerR family transcriptional regulator, aldehyde-responsive regulator
MNAFISIKEVKERTGVSEHALRYYEKVGLLQPIERSPSGWRQYTEGDVEWINTLKLLRSTGMSIQRMLHLARLRLEGDASIERRIVYFQEYQRELRKQITMREAAIKTIDKKIERHENMLRARDSKE